MFCLSCYYTSASPIVKCVDSILKHHPNETVVIVDSHSPDKSYFDSFKDNENVVILDDVNDNRHPGTFKTIYKYYPDEPYYVMIHDSIVFKKSIQEFLNSDVEFRSIMYFPETVQGRGDRHNQWYRECFADTKYTAPDGGERIMGSFGHMGILRNSMMKKLHESGFLDKFVSTDKWEDQNCERILGMVAAQEGWPADQYTIEGDFLARYNEVMGDKLEYITKLILGRQ